MADTTIDLALLGRDDGNQFDQMILAQIQEPELDPGAAQNGVLTINVLPLRIEGISRAGFRKPYDHHQTMDKRVAFKASSGHFRVLLNTLSQGVLMYDYTGTITCCNQTSHKMLGYIDGELVGKKLWDILHPSHDGEQLTDHLCSQVEQRPDPGQYLIKFIKKDGTSVDTHVNWDYAYDKDGQPTGIVSLLSESSTRDTPEDDMRLIGREYTLLLGMCKNLTESLDLHKVLQISVESVAELVGMDTAAVYLLEEDMLSLQAATPPLPTDFPEAMRFASIADHPHIQSSLTSQRPIYLFDFPKAQLTPAEQAIAAVRNVRTLLFVPLVLYGKSIGVFIVGSLEKPIALSERKIELARTLAGVSSLSLKNARLYEESNRNAAKNKQMLIERIQMMEEKSKLESRLRQTQKMEAIGNLAGGIAHDFNNMLGGIMGATELLGQLLINDTRAQKLTKTILDSTIRAADLTKQLLAFSRQSAKNSTIIDIHDLILETITFVGRTFDKSINIETNLKAKRPHVRGDHSLLHNALLNLCINSSQAMPDGGILRLNTRELFLDEHSCENSQFKLQPGQYIDIEVQDTGCGIAQEHLDLIFEPFFTTKEINKGTGLGLSSVYGTVQQHSGAINVYSEPGKGASFHILLPTCRDVEKTHIKSIGTQRGAGCILIVDDEDILRNTAKAILESLGYDVLTAENGQDALDTFNREKDRIDLVLLDMIMPVMNGRICFSKLKESDPHVPVIISSGFSHEDDLQEMKKHGLAGVIRKPYLSSDLSQLVFHVLNEKKHDDTKR